MPITRSKIFDLRSDDYQAITATTDGSTTHSAGDAVEVEEVSGFTLADVAVSSDFTLVVRASQVRAMKAAETIAAGDKLFWDDGNSVVTKTDGGSYPVLGYAVEAAASGDATVLMNFDGRGVALS